MVPTRYGRQAKLAAHDVTHEGDCAPQVSAATNLEVTSEPKLLDLANAAAKRSRSKDPSRKKQRPRNVAIVLAFAPQLTEEAARL